MSYRLAAILAMCALPIAAASAPSINGVTAPASAGLYQKFEVTFGVTTAASNYYWPYDETPNPGVAARVGVSVDGLFSNDNWQTTVVQPGFYCIPYERDAADSNRKLSNNQPWVYPSGPAVWKVRFAPTSLGPWKFKIRVTDVGGTTVGPEGAFDCVASQSHGFVRVSPTDGRYFELSDGTYLPLVGAADPGPEQYSQLATMGVNLVRSWWQSSGFLPLFGAGGQGGDNIWGGLTYTADYVRPGHLVSSIIPNLGSSWTDVWRGTNIIVAAKPNRNYRLTAMVKTVGIVRDQPGEGYGVFIGEHPSLVRSALLTGDNDWRQLTLSIPSGDRGELRVYVAEENVGGGTGYLSDVSLKEDLGGGLLGPELLTRPDLQAHTSYSQAVSDAVDRILDAAAGYGIYVKPIIEEKADSFLDCIQADGSWGPSSDANMYAGSTHACRTYQQYFWRYFIARWGSSTALHSVELFNEGDPHNSSHYAAVEALGAYFKAHDPNKHLASTSNWHSFPPLMWDQPDVGCADLHMYLGWRIASGGNRIWPGWDGSWASANDAATPGSDFQFDSTVAHTGTRSMKITVPPMPGDDGNRQSLSDAWFQCGAPPGHSLRVTYWAKGQGLVTYNKSWVRPAGLQLQYGQGGNDFAGYPSPNSGQPENSAPWGTYDWQQVQYTFTVPTTPYNDANRLLPEMLWVSPYSRANNSTAAGYVWIDDLVIQDLTTGVVLNYNGGFESQESDSYDVVAGHCAYSCLTRSFQLGKPTIRGEIGFCYTQRFGNPYKGFQYRGTSLQPGDDQLLIDDTEGIWWKKWVWAHTDPGGLVEIYWWSSFPIARSYTYGRTYLDFMSGIPLSNGHYTDAQATVSNPGLRVLGQKDITNNRAHLWIDNAKYTWKAVADHYLRPEAWRADATYGKDSTCGSSACGAQDTPCQTDIYRSKQDDNKGHPLQDTAWWEKVGPFNSAANPALPPAVSGTVTVPGLAPGLYRVEWLDTKTGATTSEERQTDDGNLALSVQNLVSDVACKIYPAPARIDLRITVPSSDVVPGQVVTVTVAYTNSGESDAENVVVSSRVPAQMDYVPGSAEASQGAYDPSTQMVTWTIPRLGPGQTGSRTFQAKVQ